MSSNRAVEIGKKLQDGRKKKIFLSWGGVEAREIAQWLKSNILDKIPGFEKAYFSEQIPTGAEWRKNLDDGLRSATHCIGIMTDAALARPWFLYELAFLKARLAEVPVLRFGPRPLEGHPLSALQIKDGAEIENLNSLVMQILKEEDTETRDLVSERIYAKGREWASLIGPITSLHSGTSSLREAGQTVSAILTDYDFYKGLREHSCMRELISKSLEELAGSLQSSVQKGHRELRMDRRRYPEYLNRLQKKPLSCRVLAIAIINEAEEFWAQTTGAEILAETDPDSQRVFVFDDAELFNIYIPHVMKHARKYIVFAISRSEFCKCNGARGDFCIATDLDSHHRVTAYYDSATANIHFTTDPAKIHRNLAVFENVLTRAERIRPPVDEDEDKEFTQTLKGTIFRARPDLLQHHSDAIPIYLYDTYEEQHPYYLEMHRCMLAEFRSRVGDPNARLPVLEIGAGTGHFTKKLIQHQYPNMSVKAMEPDPLAVEILDRKLKHRSVVAQSLRISALSYEPQGEFRFVFSSFSEHHIRPEDKERYFSIVTASMEPGGYFIVGDEFLPPHDHTDPKQYTSALEKYHHFIMDLAQAEHLFEVAHLEEMALASGQIDASPRVDFKITIDRYKRFAAAGGVELQEEFCISPKGREADVGGIYVLVFQKPSDIEAPRRPTT